jgi:hypothetical protein
MRGSAARQTLCRRNYGRAAPLWARSAPDAPACAAPAAEAAVFHQIRETDISALALAIDSASKQAPSRTTTMWDVSQSFFFATRRVTVR